MSATPAGPPDTAALLIENEGLGGAEMVLARVAADLHAQGYPILALVGKDEWLVGKLHEAGVRTHVMESYVGAKPQMVRSLRRLRETLRDQHVTTLMSWSFTTHLLAALARPNRLLPNIRGLVYDWATPRRRMLWRRVIAPRAERIVCVSRAAQEALCARVPSACPKTVVVGNAVDAERFRAPHDRSAVRRSLGVPEDCYLIGAVGRLHSVKGHTDLVAALGRLARGGGDPPHLIMVGFARPEEKHRVLKMARAQRVEPLLHLLGRRDDVPELLAAMDVFVLPSHSEGLPNALLEAMAAGRPVVATRVGGSVEVVEDGKTGILVPPKAPDVLAEAVAGLREEPARAARLGAAAQAAMQAYAWPAVIEQYAELLFPEKAARVERGQEAE